ncbi:MAG: phosphoribosylanthranilate isomerase [Defluviitaleaceae bacterium]|nr:phosphoribosylanthranilate isomerase [Defluviitaleaceae bacterium]MCL2262563.1 phosphoribosylanthranilate isomerase [Defluviitaleaceae bacterium]
MHTKIKICGLTRLCDIEAVNAAKPDYVGFVFAQSRRRVTAEQARQLRAALHTDIIPVGVFVNETAENILSLVRGGVINCIQLHGTEDENFIREIKCETSAPIIKAVPIQKHGDAQAHENSLADYLLLDHKGGGTGNTFDWSLIGTLQKPFFLAGGLNPQNIAAAIQTLNPFAADVSTGVETSPGIKNAEKIKIFMENSKRS